jgi:3'-phosphoadenosine 5'-phosphosulfate sulfotransferase (PAPS reductase)/FAD synthetase
MKRILKWPEDRPVQISVNYPANEQEKLELTLLDNASAGFYEGDKLTALALKFPALKLDDFNIEISDDKITLNEVVEENRDPAEGPKPEPEPARAYKQLYSEMKRTTQAFEKITGKRAELPLADFVNGHKNIIVTFSGGKDSVAAALWTLAHIEDRTRLTILYGDTGIDFPDMAEYLEYCQAKFDHPITKVGPGDDQLFRELLAQYGYPGYNNNWCTLKLKTEFLFDFYKKNGMTEADTVLVMGDRQAEGKRRSAHRDRGQFHLRFGYGKLNTEFACPVLTWTDDEVGQYAQQHGVSLYPGYLHYDRNGCFCCAAVPKHKWRIIREQWPDLWARALEYFAIACEDPQYRQYFQRDVFKAIGYNEPIPPPRFAKYVNRTDIALTLATVRSGHKIDRTAIQQQEAS